MAQYKYDGSCLRAQYNKHKGWCQFGTRTRLFDKTDPLYGQALPVFDKKYKEHLTWIIRNDPLFERATEVIAFMEFFGPSSFAGEHKLEEPKDLKLFDINVGQKGFIDPFTFRDKFKHLDIAETIEEGILDDKFARKIREGREPRVFEGVICKGGVGHKLWSVKIKSQLYLEKLWKHEKS